MTRDIAVYIRVSSEEQNLDSQISEITQWLDRQCIPEDRVEWFSDKASGKDIGHRPEFMRLDQEIAVGRIKTVVVWKIDRMSRSLFDGVTILGKWCQHGVRFVSITQHLDLSGVVGQIIAAVLLGMAQIERENIQERAAAGIKVARQKGRYKGRKRGSYDKATREKIPAILKLHDAGIASPYTIARTIGGIHPETVKSVLKNKKRLATATTADAAATAESPVPSVSSSAPEPVSPVA